MTDKRKEFNKIKNKFIYKLEQGCCNCGKEAKHLHHIVPLSLGGENIDSNIAPLCDECHGKIHKINFNRELQQAGIKRAKAEGKYKGRKEIKIDDNFNTLYEQYKNREINKCEFAKRLNVSRPTLDRLIKKKINENK